MIKTGGIKFGKLGKKTKTMGLKLPNGMIQKI
jgi:hypothetical protein